MLELLLSMLIFTQCDTCPPLPKLKVAVFELGGAGIEKELLTTVSDLLRLELAECERYKVIDKETMIDTLGEDLTVVGMEKAIAFAESLGATFVVTGHMTKLGNKIIISVSLIDRWNKKKIFSDKLTWKS